MHSGSLVFSIFLIFTGTAILATIALFTRQSLLVAYLLLGMLLGPWGLKWVADTSLITHISEVGIVFLLFLLGLHLHPQDLIRTLRSVTVVALISSLIFAALGFFIARAFSFNMADAMLVGAAMMFSSTIIGLKLLPTTILHHQHTGEIMIGILLMQDLIAIVVLWVLHLFSEQGASGLTMKQLLTMIFALPGLMGFAYLLQRFVLIKLLERFDGIQEYIFLLATGWCLGLSQAANYIGLTDGIGAFIAGISLAASPISFFIAENLKPLRDFFLVLFFFSIGASFNLSYLPMVILPATLLAIVAVLIKPWLFSALLRYTGENKSVAREVGARLGQTSEFSLLLAYIAATAPALITEKASNLIQTMTILSFVVSCYWIVWRYPTPIALSDRMRRD